MRRIGLLKIVIYSALKEDFFELLYNINCEARWYVGCTDVKRYFDINRVERQELIEIESGVRISRPIVVEEGLRGWSKMFSSLSHNGILAVYCYLSGHRYQLTDLANGRQINILMENYTHTGFYDDLMLALTNFKTLRVCPVERMFMKESAKALRGIGGVKVLPIADVTLLQSTRVLIFNSTDYIPHEFNVDTHVTRELDMGMNAYSFASLTGIDVGVRGVFKEKGNGDFTYSLSNNNYASIVAGHDSSWGVCTFIPSSSDPRDIRKGMKIYDYGEFFVDTTRELRLKRPFKCKGFQSIIRLYQDIFLVFDCNSDRWCLVKILVP